MGDLTPRGAPIGHGNSKIRRKKLDIMNIDVALEQRRIEILEKEEEIERMEIKRGELLREVVTLEQQFTTNTHQE